MKYASKKDRCLALILHMKKKETRRKKVKGNKILSCHIITQLIPSHFQPMDVLAN